MLLRLSIQDLAIIDHLTLDFTGGFTVLTGETGAGKSIIVGALNLVLGERASSDDVRTGCDGAEVEAVFDVAALRKVRQLLGEWELSAGDELVIRREINSQGRSRCVVNGRALPLVQLKQLGDLLVDLHGQHQHQSLLRAELHREILDSYGHDDIGPRRASWETLYTRHGELVRRLGSLKRDEREMARQKDILEFQLNEIQKAEIVPGEDEALEGEWRRLSHSDALKRHTASATDILYEGEMQTPTADQLLGEAEGMLLSSAQLDPTLQSLSERLTSARAEIRDVADALRNYADDLEADPARLAEVEERMRLLRQLKKKYGATLEEILAVAEKFEKELHLLTHSREEEERLLKELAELEHEMANAAEDLSMVRKSASIRFSRGLQGHLGELEMPSVKFEVRLARLGENQFESLEEDDREDTPLSLPLSPKGARENTGDNGRSAKSDGGRMLRLSDGKLYRVFHWGVDQVEFLISPNAGEDLKPLRRIASGGELSRVMLALKILLNRKDAIPTLVFDEIDTGISGRTGARIGEKMAALAEGHQVICITHLPQIAARGMHHYAVTKVEEKKRTLTRVVRLGDAERRVEIARLLGGDKNSRAALDHAAELLNHSNGNTGDARSRSQSGKIS